MNPLISTNLTTIPTFENERRKNDFRKEFKLLKKMVSILDEELLLIKN